MKLNTPLVTLLAGLGWALPLAGAVVFVVLVGLWFTSAYWFFSTFGVHR
ncbi:MAG: DUF6529 family protein [Streptosporangiaceae bacterium]